MTRLSRIALAATTATGIALGFDVTASAATRHHHSHAVRPITLRHATLRFATPRRAGPRPGRFVELAGDRESGLGFYPLPLRYRHDARWRRYDPRGEAIRYATASQAGYGLYDGVGGEIYGDRHHHGIFNPVDGYGTPFFAGYYGPAGDPDEDRGPFGKAY